MSQEQKAPVPPKPDPATKLSGAPQVPYKRHMKNYFINKPMQSRMSYYFVAFSICLIGVMLLFLNVYMAQIRTIIANVAGIPMTTQLAIDTRLHTILAASLLFLLLAAIVSVVYGIIISHRVAGPMFAIIRYVETLKKGNYEDRRKLRPYDELIPIMDALHGLAEELKKRHGSTPQK